MKQELEVQDIVNCIEKDEYVEVEGIDEWIVTDYGNAVYIEVNFEDRTQLTLSSWKDEFYENRLKNFVQMVNNFWNK